MADRAEIIDQRDVFDAELVADLRRADDPGIVGELEELARNRAGDGDGGGAGQRTADLCAERLPSGLQAGMFGGLEGRRFTEMGDVAVLDLGEREPGVGSANVDRDDLHYRALTAVIPAKAGIPLPCLGEEDAPLKGRGLSFGSMRDEF